MKKLLLLFSIFISLIAPARSQSKIEGVVTYFFNDYQGDKADIGCKLYVIDSALADSLNWMAIDSFAAVKTQWQLYSLLSGHASSSDLQNSRSEKYKMECLKYGITNKEDFDNLSKRAFHASLLFQNYPKKRQTTIDGSGHYSVSLNKGTYFLLFVSKGRTSHTFADLLGTLFFVKQALNEGENIEISHRFDQY